MATRTTRYFLLWPQNVGDEKSYGDISVSLEKQLELSHCFEKLLKVAKQGSDVVIKISLLQIKSWKKRFVDLQDLSNDLNCNIFLFISSPEQIIDIAGNIIASSQQQNPDDRQIQPPIVLNCMTGGAERSGLVTLGVSTIFATQMRKPTLLSELT